MPAIRVLVKKDGGIVVDLQNFIGKLCEQEFCKLAEILKQYGVDISVQQEQKKPEYYVEAATAEVSQA